jgi:hypothetical protein
MKIIISDNQYNLLKEARVAIENIEGLKKFWRNQQKKGQQIRFDKEDLDFWGITTRQEKFYAQAAFRELVGDDEFTKKVIKKLIGKTFSTKNFDDRITGGYDFEWVITDMEYRDYDFYLYGKTLPGGTVTLMDGRHLSLKEAIKDEDLGWEIEQEIKELVLECMDEIVLPVTGNEIISIGLKISTE